MLLLDLEEGLTWRVGPGSYYNDVVAVVVDSVEEEVIVDCRILIFHSHARNSNIIKPTHNISQLICGNNQCYLMACHSRVKNRCHKLDVTSSSRSVSCFLGDESASMGSTASCPQQHLLTESFLPPSSSRTHWAS